MIPELQVESTVCDETTSYPNPIVDDAVSRASEIKSLPMKRGIHMVNQSNQPICLMKPSDSIGRNVMLRDGTGNSMTKRD